MDERLKILNNITEITKDNIPIEIKNIRWSFHVINIHQKKIAYITLHLMTNTYQKRTLLI